MAKPLSSKQIAVKVKAAKRKVSGLEAQHRKALSRERKKKGSKKRRGVSRKKKSSRRKKRR